MDKEAGKAPALAGPWGLGTEQVPELLDLGKVVGLGKDLGTVLVLADIWESEDMGKELALADFLGMEG